MFSQLITYCKIRLIVIENVIENARDELRSGYEIEICYTTRILHLLFLRIIVNPLYIPLLGTTFLEQEGSGHSSQYRS